MLCGFYDEGAQDPCNVICQAARRHRQREQQIKIDAQLAYEYGRWESQVGTAQTLQRGAAAPSAAGLQLMPL